MKANRLLPLVSALSLLSWHAATAANPPVHVKKLPGGGYELTVTVTGANDPQAAMPILLPEAIRRCGSASPQFGHFRFTATEPVAGRDAAKPASVTVVQDVACGTVPSTAPSQPANRPTAGMHDDKAIRSRTLAYLEAKDRGDFEAAHAMVATETQVFMTRDKWFAPRIAFNRAAGSAGRREIIRISWVDDPPDAPPGVYAAADYRSDYPSGAFYCGFVAWRQQPDGSYRIVREEEGQVSPADARTIAPAQMAGARVKLGCRD